MNRVSWKTTAGGILSVVIAILAFAQKILYGQPIEAGDITTLLAIIPIAYALLNARDNDRTSEEVGANVWAAKRKREELNK